MVTFTVGTNQKFDTAEDIEPKLTGLKSGVTQVDLGGNSYGVGACKALADKLATVDTLEVANLDDMFTGRLREEIPQSMDDLLSALLKCPKLHTVNLSDNAFGIATIAPLEKFLAQHAPLQHLILANNGFGPEAGTRVGNALEALATKKQAEHKPLETVVCGRNRLENGSMEAWARFIKVHGSIKELRLYQNGIRQEGIEHLFREGLVHAPLLTTLDLQDNTFTERGSAAMADAIEKWPLIKEIGVSDCLLSAEGSSAIAEKLASLETLGNLEVLKLQYNEMDEKGLSHVARAVENNLKKLKLLELNGNRFSEDHHHVGAIEAVFAERGFGELDELDDMEIESDEDEDEEENDETFDELEAGSRDAQLAEDEPVAAEESSSADELAEKLAKVGV